MLFSTDLVFIKNRVSVSDEMFLEGQIGIRLKTRQLHHLLAVVAVFAVVAVVAVVAVLAVFVDF